MTENSTATLTTYITDMHALINHGLRTLDAQVVHMRKRNLQSDALAAVLDFQRVLRGHQNQLQGRARALGGKTTRPLKDLVTALTGIAHGLISAVRPEDVAKGIRDDYTFLSHVAIGYLMLHTTASALGDGVTANLAEQGYRDAAQMVMRIDQIMPTIVLQELRQDGLPVGPVAEQSRMMVQRAWDRSVVPSGLGGEQTAPGPAA